MAHYTQLNFQVQILRLQSIKPYHMQKPFRPRGSGMIKREQYNNNRGLQCPVPHFQDWRDDPDKKNRYGNSGCTQLLTKKDLTDKTPALIQLIFKRSTNGWGGER